MGWLVTTWLSPGRHRFVVRVVDRTGRSAEDAVTARVVAPPAAPPALARGTWRRVDKPSALLWFDRTGVTHAGADGTGVVYEYETRGENDCNYSGPLGRYRWSVAGDLLTLKVVHEGCRGRGGFLAHTWRHVR
jgi:hypothetical protein